MGRPKKEVAGEPVAASATMEAVRQEVRSGVVKVSVQQPQPKTTRSYWIGVLAGAPVECVHIGGVDFKITTEVVTFGRDGETIRTSRRGRLAILNDDQIRKITSDVTKKFIRTNGAIKELVDIRTPRTSPRAGDESLAKYVYMVEVEDGMPAGYETGKPEPMFAE